MSAEDPDLFLSVIRDPQTLYELQSVWLTALSSWIHRNKISERRGARGFSVEVYPSNAKVEAKSSWCWRTIYRDMHQPKRSSAALTFARDHANSRQGACNAADDYCRQAGFALGDRPVDKRNPEPRTVSPDGP